MASPVENNMNLAEFLLTITRTRQKLSKIKLILIAQEQAIDTIEDNVNSLLSQNHDLARQNADYRVRLATMRQKIAELDPDYKSPRDGSPRGGY